MQFTTVRSKEKDYDIYLKSEKLVHSQQEHEKNVSQLRENGLQVTNTVELFKDRKMVQKMQFTTVRSKEKDQLFRVGALTNTVAAIQRQKKVDPCYLEIKKCSSQLLGARKKIMTSI